MFAHWASEAPPKEAADRSRLHQKYVRSLTDAAKYGKNRPGPRRRLLADALSRDDPTDALPWADEVIALDATDPDASYVKAIEALDRQPPDLAAAKERLAILEQTEASKVRTLWVRARLALASKDEAALEAGARPDPIERPGRDAHALRAADSPASAAGGRGAVGRPEGAGRERRPVRRRGTLAGRRGRTRPPAASAC